jgi:Uma2 family endonuclease
MQSRIRASIADLYQLPGDGKAEIVDGEVVLMSPTGDLPGRASLKITLSLYEYEGRTGLGRAYPDNTGFRVNLPNRESFSPDASFYAGPRTGGKFLEGAPLFAAEIRSEGDYGPAAERAMAARRADYFAAGTEVVWDVDVLQDRVVRVYRATDPENPTVYRRGQVAEAEPALPGWRMAVVDLFD